MQSSWHSYFVLWGYRVQISCRILLPELRQFISLPCRQVLRRYLKLPHVDIHASTLVFTTHFSPFHTTVRSTTTESSFIRSVCLTNVQRPSNGAVWSIRPMNTVGRLRLRQVATTLEGFEDQTSSNNVRKICLRQVATKLEIWGSYNNNNVRKICLRQVATTLD